MHLEPVPLSQPFPPSLTTATDRALALALNADGDGRNRELQQAMRALCDEARRQGMRAEEVIVLFKKTWHTRPELQRMTREETSRRFDAAVTMCVEEYYRDGR